MGIVVPPVETCGFDGKILIKCVSEIKNTTKTSHNKKISEEFAINHLLKDNEWVTLLPDEDVSAIDTKELIHNIVEFYNLNPDIEDHLFFSYHTHTGTGKTEKVERFNKGKLLEDRFYIDSDGNTHPLYIDQLILVKEVKAGSSYHADTTCDSTFMLNHVDAIGRAIRHAYRDVASWNIPIYLVMDNAGRHRTVEAKETFFERLEMVYNIQVNWQVLNSPDTNLLDLGVWMTTYSVKS